ncbi:Say1p [Saccharomyces cerevisiae x Saccharomyces kudriavzevii VIN7]|uniref:Say1p n=1 Tax=Saccharomyces cerevisiae x Saccharomyces kudriavzevii (strain VIN7) TaxID=1095631 RepID=H0GVF5_SACCK|nr:Say1p [Saccharomyces cerevisiae x Saccharomyces kudriavzevii VIN7]CAI5276365.1 AIS_HP2_G0021270.mRNA.1.CDS.1 [Saccharomyces cerevisiae]CAI6535627.1 AIS_HP2_G0021270.mRNA.1.CDS.1 [Saccharomyces cerevisiae]
MSRNTDPDSKSVYYRRFQDNEPNEVELSKDARENDATFRWSALHLHLLHGLKFITLLLTVVPVCIFFDSMKIIVQRKRRFCLDHLNRIFLRQSSWILDERICQYVLNPLFVCLYPSTFSNPTYVRYEVPIEDQESPENNIFQNRALNAPKVINAKFYHYFTPEGFDPSTDPVLVFYHGGGYALKLTPTSLSFLNNMRNAFPKMAIIVPDYTVTATDEQSKKYPLQILQSVAVFDYVSNTIGCRNVMIMGDSAGGNAVLNIVLYLSKCHRDVYPKKVIAISPWANATFLHEGEKKYMQRTQQWDGLCLKSHSMFGRMFVGRNPNVDFTGDPFVNIERNFETKEWQEILKKCSVMITYGSDELLSLQNEILAKKMSKASEGFDHFTSKNVLVEHQGYHTGPILNYSRDMDWWTRIPSIARILEFMHS